MRSFSARAGASALLAAIICHGCVVQSVHPFFSSDSVVALANVWGEWDRIEKDADAPGKPWVFGEKSVTSYDEGKKGALEVVYFKVGKNTFIDATAGDLDEACANTFWVFNVAPVHTLAKIIQTKNGLEVRPFDDDWLKTQLREKRVNLPRVSEGENILFTATPEEWMEFLKQHGDSNEAFPKENALTFTRHVEEAPAEQP